MIRARDTTAVVGNGWTLSNTLVLIGIVLSAIGLIITVVKWIWEARIASKRLKEAESNSDPESGSAATTSDNNSINILSDDSIRIQASDSVRSE